MLGCVPSLGVLIQVQLVLQLRRRLQLESAAVVSATVLPQQQP